MWREILLSALPRGVAEQIRIQQLNRLAYLCCVMPLTGVNTLAFVDWACWEEGRTNLILVTSAGLVFLYGLVLARALAWRREADLGRRAQHHLRCLNALFVPAGVLWGVLLICLVPGSDAAQRGLLLGVAVGAISSAALNVPLSAVLAFGGPVTIGTGAALIATQDWKGIPTGACLVGYVALTLIYALHSNRTFIKKIRSEIALKEQADVIGLLLRDFVETSSDWLWQVDSEFRLTEVSERMARAAACTIHELRGRSLEALFCSGAADGGGREYAATLLERLSSRAAFRDVAVSVEVAGEVRWWSMSGKPCFDAQGAFTGYRGVSSDITIMRRATERTAYLAHHDSLTGLPNRTAFADALAQGRARAGRQSAALLCLDLDGFKGVNDTLGHAVGDAVLVAVAGRLRHCIRAGDVAARLGGDEFAIIMTDATAETAAQLASRVIEVVSQPFSIEGRSVEVGVSIGLALAHSDDDVPDKLLQNADLALYRAKAEGKCTWRMFEPAMYEQEQRRLVLRAELRRALERDEFRLAFQPVLGSSSRRVVAAEALLRWQHPSRGVVPPTEFIPLIEETNLVGPIGAWVIEQAIREAASWPSPVIVAVNLSPLQFRGSKLVDVVTGALRAHGLPPSRLELEITESLLLQPTDETLETLRQLRTLGVKIALDDFGTGYSALSYLRRFPFDTLKIDRSFVVDLGRSEAAATIIRAIVLIAQSVGMSVTAEGVETNEQEAVLTACGCDRLQGFLYSRPRVPEDLHRFIAANLGTAPSIAAA